NAAAEPWRGDYRFVFSVHLPNAGEAQRWAGAMRSMLHQPGQGGGQLDNLVQFMFRSFFPWLDRVEAVKASSPDPKELRFTVTTRGTKITTRRGWIHEPALFFGAVPLSLFHAPVGALVHVIEGILVNTVGAWVAVLIGIIITA